MTFKLFQLGTLLGIFLLGCQPHKNNLSTSSTTFRDIKTVYQIDSSGAQVSREMYLMFTCLLDGSTESKRTEIGFYQEPLSAKSANSYLEVREATYGSEKASGFTIKELLIIDNLNLSNLSVISLLVGKDSKLLGTQMSITSLPQMGGVFLEFSRQTGIGLLSAMSASGTPANMKCKSVRVP